ncbi:MAG: hypothetical protein Q7T03_01230 [Deltaproteobacteria bacterium]|nr:hypothetical protein [Deltaproteobacteria bacterium]
MSTLKPIKAETNYPECTRDYAAFPKCQIGESVYIDADLDGDFSSAKDIVIGEDQSSTFSSHPDFPGCFYASASALLDDPESLRIKHGAWPSRFSVMTAARQNQEAMNFEFLKQFVSQLQTVKTEEDSRLFFKEMAQGIKFASFIPEHVEREKKLGQQGCYQGLCTIKERWAKQQSKGILGENPGWVFNPATLEEDAQRRYIFVIYSDAVKDENKDELKNIASDITSFYQLPNEHLQWITPRLTAQKIRSELDKWIQTLPEGSNAEVMILYTAHGGPKESSSTVWRTELDFFEPKLSEKEFRALIMAELPKNKIASALLLINSCHSGMLVE